MRKMLSNDFVLTYIFFIADNISISMYIVCVILCLFSALSRRIGAVQMSIIIIIIGNGDDEVMLSVLICQLTY